MNQIKWNRSPEGRVYLRERGNNGKRWPREKSAYMDGWADDQVEAWVQNYNLTVASRRSGHAMVPEKIHVLVDEFTAYQSQGDLSEGTVKHDKTNILHAAEYLSTKTDRLALWPQFSLALPGYLQKKKKYSGTYINQIQISLRKFWRWLRVHKKLVSGELELETVKGHARSQDTPLQFALSPDEVIAFARTCTDPTVRMLALCGYFASLRPQEVFALCLNDFATGLKAKGLEACKVMKGLGMFDGMAINIEKQQRAYKKKQKAKPKKDSKGIVAVFHKDAASLIVAELKALQAAGKMQIFGYNNKHYYALWKKEGKLGVTLKDLRRASIYYLGHHTDIKIEQLKEHARHKNIQTTSLYFRRPFEKFDEVDDLVFDLDA